MSFITFSELPVCPTVGIICWQMSCVFVLPIGKLCLPIINYVPREQKSLPHSLSIIFYVCRPMCYAYVYVHFTPPIFIFFKPTPPLILLLVKRVSFKCQKRTEICCSTYFGCLCFLRSRFS